MLLNIKHKNTFSVEDLRQGKALPECPLCLDEMMIGNAIISMCGHMICTICVEKLFEKVLYCFPLPHFCIENH